MTQANAVKSQKAIRFRGRSYIAFVLAPELPTSDWLAALDGWTQNSPGFFTGRPVVLDFCGVSLDTSEIVRLLGALSERGIRIIGCEGLDESQLGPSLPPLLRGGRPAGAEMPAEKPISAPAERAEQHGLLIETPLRSGQTVVFPYGDVTVLGSVGSGAEIAAGGSIHVYGALRGRALAGSMGNARARIFCRKNEAELLAIDGYYLTAENMDASLRSRPIQVWLKDDFLSMAPLD